MTNKKQDEGALDNYLRCLYFQANHNKNNDWKTFSLRKQAQKRVLLLIVQYPGTNSSTVFSQVGKPVGLNVIGEDGRPRSPTRATRLLTLCPHTLLEPDRVRVVSMADRPAQGLVRASSVRLSLSRDHSTT